ncbi:hypothetical protein BZA77DRAFT_297924 [Pyronema omphalodes]|nr:hypothetical protein BZA77DRAFT_297924 [Pyronema omphalodes]
MYYTASDISLLYDWDPLSKLQQWICGFKSSLWAAYYIDAMGRRETPAGDPSAQERDIRSTEVDILRYHQPQFIEIGLEHTCVQLGLDHLYPTLDSTKVNERNIETTIRKANIQAMPPNIKIEIHEGAIHKAVAQAKKNPAQLKDDDKNNQVVKKGNASGVKPITPTNEKANPGHAKKDSATAISSPPALDGRLSSEKTDFEKAEEKKTAHFMKRLENARLELQKRDRELEKLDEFLRSLTMRRTNTAKRETTRKTANERKKARGAQSVSDAKDVPVAATVTVPVGSPVKDETPGQALSESSGNKKKAILHSKSSSGNKVSKSSTSGWTAINHKKST